MSGWALVWYWVIVVALFSYFTLAIVLAIGGFFDVKTMFRRLAAAALRGVSESAAAALEPPAPPSADRGSPQDPSRHESDREKDS
jgi:hypothetical protein